jgi:hypothetical protein
VVNRQCDDEAPLEPYVVITCDPSDPTCGQTSDNNDPSTECPSDGSVGGSDGSIDPDALGSARFRLFRVMGQRAQGQGQGGSSQSASSSNSCRKMGTPKTSSQCSIYQDGSATGSALSMICQAFPNGPKSNQMRGCLQSLYTPGSGYLPLPTLVPTGPGSFFDVNSVIPGTGAHLTCLADTLF